MCRQANGEVAGVQVPEELQAVWKEACKTRSKTAKNNLFAAWLRAGGTWGRLL